MASTNILIDIGILCSVWAVLFQLVTLAAEFNASAHYSFELEAIPYGDETGQEK